MKAFLTGYYVTSFFFMANPHFLWGKPHTKNQYFNQLMHSEKMIVIGHRGGAHEGPESTLELFRQNNDHTDMFECDICTTKDKQIVINHDQNLSRTCGVDKSIEEVDYKDLPVMKEEYEAYGGEDVNIKTTKNRLPLLKQAYSQFPSKLMMVQIKTANPEMLSGLKQIEAKYKREDKTIYGYIGEDYNKQLQNISQNSLTFYSQKELIKYFGLFFLGLAPFVPIRKGFLVMPVVTEGFKFQTKKQFTGYWAYLIEPYFFFINLMTACCPLLVPHLKERGILTFYFNINKEEDLGWASKLKGSGLMSDHPKMVWDYLEKQQKHFVYHPKEHHHPHQAETNL